MSFPVKSHFNTESAPPFIFLGEVCHGRWGKLGWALKTRSQAPAARRPADMASELLPEWFGCGIRNQEEFGAFNNISKTVHLGLYRAILANFYCLF